MNEIEAKLRETVTRLLADGDIGYFIGWEQAGNGGEITRAAFIERPQDAVRLVWNEKCNVSLAKYALDDKYPEKKIGICLRGCDSRAVNRMIADKQLIRENLYLIGIPCDGKGNAACEICGHKNPVLFDVLIGPPVPESASGRFAKIAPLEAMSADERYEYWSAQFGKCIRCYACRNICPACNCRECYADQRRAGWQGKQMNTAQNQIFGLTRAYHVGDRCIECGECERVCPMGIPVMAQPKKMLKDICELFGPYECGLGGDETPALGRYAAGDSDGFM